MSGTHTHAGLPGRAVAKWRGAVRPALVLVAVLLSTFSLVSMGAQPSGASTVRWSAVEFSASEAESLSGVSFWTPADGLRYTIGIYRRMENGSPEGILSREQGRLGTSGFYTVALEKPLHLEAGDCYVVVLGLRGDGVADKAASPERALAPSSPDRPVRLFTSGTGEAFLATGADAFGIHVRTVADSSPVPEAVAISKFVVTTPPVVAGAPMTFTISASGTTAGHALTYVLDFGDGSTVMAPAALGSSPVVNFVTPPYTYAKAGTYTAKLTVTDTVDSSTLTVTLSVVVQIQITATADPLCGLAALNVCFTASADLGTPPYIYKWTFGDGSAASNEQNPCHAYMNAGTYTATILVTDSAGATGTQSFTITVTLPLKVSVTASTTDGLDPTVVNFCVAATQGLPPYTYSWDFGDGSQTGAGAQCPQHAFNGVGSYEVVCTVSDSCGQTVASTPITITVHQSPWIRILQPLTGTVVHGLVNLTSAVMVPAGATVTRVEYYVNGTLLGFSTGPSPWAVVWDTSGLNGTFTITAKAYDSKGEVNSTEVAVIVTVQNPALDGRVDVVHNPFRLKVYGLNFEQGCVIRVNGAAVPATVRKGVTLAVAKGGNTLKAMVPRNVPVIITVTNPDGGTSNQSTFQR